MQLFICVMKDWREGQHKQQRGDVCKLRLPAGNYGNFLKKIPFDGEKVCSAADDEGRATQQKADSRLEDSGQWAARIFMNMARCPQSWSLISMTTAVEPFPG